MFSSKYIGSTAFNPRCAGSSTRFASHFTHATFCIEPRRIIDPLAELEIDVQSFDIPRLITVYPDQAGIRWWTKAWFNNQEEGENSIEITQMTAIRFLQNQIDKDTMLEEYFPKQMEIYRNAIEQTRVQLLKQINIS